MCCCIGDVFTLNQCFRAENSNTTRHLSEFLMLEVELAFANLNDIINVAEEYIKEIISFALYKSEDINYLNSFHDKNIKNKLENILNSKFVIITYEEAINILKKKKMLHTTTTATTDTTATPPDIHTNDISFENEKFLTDSYFKSPVVITNYPKHIKPFYMKLNDDGKNTVACMDIIFPTIGELAGGSEREIKLTTLKKQIKEKKLNLSLYKPYLDLRKYGNIPHAGFGIGIDRLIMLLSSIHNIRDVVPFPRASNSLFM
uniref:Aminoacyl-transfer RNA synthetases class-II family profile domain-containing protein n=1 Tax=Piliocolobus tephrosceles TaxID=591936 RepID=A0A8C9LIR0_9PRIM